jgi:ATP-dependent DNA helicase RecQ
MTRQQAEIELKKRFGFNQFYDKQWQVIEKLLKGERVLFIEKTGFGKSLCYQFPATQMQGVTIVFTPLIALMRDQVRSMSNKGIRAAAIHSHQEDADNEAVIEKAQNNQLDIIYIAPERMENASWISAARQMKIAMVVIDEAHLISVWGQTFRTAYRRIVNLVMLLPKKFPVLATTATATQKIEQDILKQIGSSMMMIRGNLMRPNISLYVVPVNSEDEKFYWLAKFLPKLPKTGIVYTGTQTSTDIFSNWLQFLNFKSAAYSGRLDGESRQRVEADFINNKYDCVVSTNALGMGIDKPDIRFIIHTQIPASPIHYYQEIGRAGRDSKQAYAILLYNKNEDVALPKAFIDSSKPSAAKYEKVIAVTRKALMGRNEIIKAANLKQTEVSVILADLIDQNIINEQMAGRSKKYFFNTNGPALNLSSFELLRQEQLIELDKILAYTETKECRMHYLCNYLGDSDVDNCGVCDNDLKQRMRLDASAEIQNKLQEFRETFFPVLEVQTQRSKIINGVAASYYGVSNVGAAIHHSKYQNGGDFPDWLLRLTLKAFRKYFGSKKFDLVLYVPPTESGKLVKNFAEKIASTLKIPISHNLVKTAVTAPQKMFQSGISKKDNVAGKFTYTSPAEIKGKNILLIDDIFDSGCTIKEIGNYLTSIDAASIAPLVIARTVGGDI